MSCIYDSSGIPFYDMVIDDSLRGDVEHGVVLRPPQRRVVVRAGRGGHLAVGEGGRCDRLVLFRLLVCYCYTRVFERL